MASLARHKERAGRFGLGIACGLLIALSVPPFGWWPLSWVGLAAVALALPASGVWERLALGAGVGLGQYAIGVAWVNEFSTPGYIGVVIFNALYSMIALGLVPTARRRGVVLGMPAALVLADWARDRFPLGGFPLAGMSLGQAAGPLVATVRLGGSLLLTAEMAVVGVAIAELVRLGRAWLVARSSWTASAAARRTAVLTAAGAGALTVVAVAFPLGGWLSPDGSGGGLPSIRVALVQGGGPRGTRAIHTDPEVVFQRHLAASASLDPPLDLVVWPEGVLQSHQPFSQTADASDVADLAARLGATVLVGVEQDVGTTRYLNEVVAWDSEKNIVAQYVKNHLVPFGEYVPWRSVIGKLFNVSDVPLDAIPGHGPGFIRTPAGPLGVMISFEVFFDERARGGVRAGGEALVVPTNTASYRSSQVPTQELAADRLRAWETGRWLVQVTPTGYSAVVDPQGRVLERTTLGAQQVLIALVPLEKGRTFYVDVGDLPVALVGVALLAFAWFSGGRGPNDRWRLRR